MVRINNNTFGHPRKMSADAYGYFILYIVPVLYIYDYQLYYMH